MAAVLFRPEDRDAPHDAPAGLVLVEEKRCEPAPLVVRGARDEDEVRGAVGAGDEPFAAGDDVFVALLLGLVRIMEGSEPPPGRRLGHREGRAHFALDDRLAAICPSAPCVPTRRSRFMLPSSGAMQLMASGPKIERAASS